LPPSAAEVGLQGSSLEDGIHPDIFTLGAGLRWQFAGGVTLTNLLRYTDGEVRFDGIFPGDAAVSGIDFAAAHGGVAPAYTVIGTGAAYDPTQLVQNHGHWVVNKEFEALQDDLRFNFLLGAHDLAVGAYFADYSMDDRWSLGNLLLMDVSDQPNRLALPGVTDPNGFTQYSFFNLLANYDATQYALYVSDEWQITDALRVDLGVRYDPRAMVDQQRPGWISINPRDSWDNATALAGTARTEQPGFQPHRLLGRLQLRVHAPARDLRALH
jgi:outer membrane receptor protein involved in Fe transport